MFFSEFSPTEQTFLKNFHFFESGITDSELQHLFRVLIENNDVFSKFTYDVGKITREIHVKLKKDAELRKQRHFKVPLHYWDRLEFLLNEVQRAGIVREMGSDVEMGWLFTNPIIILPKGDTVKLVIDARYLNSITDSSNYSWPLEPVQMLLTRLDGVYYTISDLASTYNQVPLSEDTKKLTSFVVGGKQYMFERGFCGLCGLPNFFSRIMTIYFAEMIAKKQAITYNDDVILQGKTEAEMWKSLESYFKCLKSTGLKAAPNKTKLFLRKVQFLGHIVSHKGIQPVAKNVQDLKDLKSPENKRDVMRVLGNLGFYSTFIKNLHVDSKPFYDLLRDDVPFKWTKEREEIFQNIKDRISEETILAVPNPKYPFHIHVDSCSLGTGSILVIHDIFGEGKNINNRRKWQAPPMVVEAEVHENYYSEIESDSESSDNEASDEDLTLNQEIEESRKTNLYSTPSNFFIHESNKTLKLTTDTLDCDNILVNQENDSVLKTVRAWISKGKLPTKDVESRQCKGLLGYANQFEKLFVDKETQLVCRRSKHSPKQICLP